MAPERTSLVISPDQLTRLMLVAVALLLCASTAGQMLKYFLGHDHLFGLTRLTYLNGEATIPAWFSSIALLMVALVLAVIGTTKHRTGDGTGWYWTTLAFGFIYLSMDEAAAIHELWGEP